MSTTPASLYSSASITAAKTVVIAAETSTVRAIRKATFTNNSGGTLTVGLYITPTGSAEVQLAVAKVLINGQTWSCPDAEGHILSAAGTMSAEASGTGIDLLISGFKFT